MQFSRDHGCIAELAQARPERAIENDEVDLTEENVEEVVDAAEEAVEEVVDAEEAVEEEVEEEVVERPIETFQDVAASRQVRDPVMLLVGSC